MELKQVKGLGPSKAAKLKEAGITSVEELARADVAAVAKDSGLSVSQVKDFKQRAAGITLVADAKNLGPASLGAFAHEAARNLRDVTAASLDLLRKELKVAQSKMAEMQERANKAAKELAREAKTPAGRARIGAEAKQLAQEGAAKAQDAAETAAAWIQDESKRVMAQARDLQANAPKYVEDAKVRAETILHEAQKKIEAVAAKAQNTVKIEAEKVKAEGEELLRRTKAKFNSVQA